MKFSESWLRSFVDPACSGHEFSHLLTMAGLEIEEEASVAPAFDQVVVARILAVDKHPGLIACTSAGSTSARASRCRRLPPRLRGCWTG